MTPVHADRREDEGDEGEDADQHRGRSRTRDRSADHLVERADVDGRFRFHRVHDAGHAGRECKRILAGANEECDGATGTLRFGNEDRLLNGAVEGGSHVADDADDRPFNIVRLAAPGTDRTADICALDDALTALAMLDPRRAQIVELRFFGGLSVEETAEALSISPQTVMRGWKVARAWLAREVRQ